MTPTYHGQSPGRRALALAVLCLADWPAGVGRTDAKSNHGNGGFLLSCRITGVRRWSRCAAITASRSGALRLGQQ